MKLTLPIVLCAAAMLPAQNPPKPDVHKAIAAKPAAQAPAAAAHATLADLQRDFQVKKLTALEAYVKSNPTAKDVGEALVEAAGLAKTLNRNEDAQRLAEAYLKDHADGEEASSMRMTRALALRDAGKTEGAEKALREVVDKAGNDVNGMVEAATMLGEMLLEAGKKDAAVEMMNKVGESRADVRGLKEHCAGIVQSYELIGTEPTAIGQPDINGKAIDLAEYKGKVVLLDFWATWCGPCVAELPNVIAAYEKFHPHGFEILGISLDKDRAAFDRFIAERKMTWRHQYDGKGWQNAVAAAYGVKSIPATYLIGPDGKIAAIGLRGEQLKKRLARFYPAGK